MTSVKYFFLLPILFLGFILHAQQNDLPADIKASILQRIDAGKNPSIVVGILDSNGPRYFSFGKTTENGKKVDEHSIYEIGSISKVFTATLLADMIIKGQLSVDDPIEIFLPISVHVPTYEGKHITLGNLSDHTSSLPRMPDNFDPADPLNPYADYTVDQMYSFLSSYTLTRPIGSQYEYSNLAVGLLGHILSLKAGVSYEDLLTRTVTAPLHMDETRITLSGEMKKNLAIGHTMGMEVPNWDLPTLAGAGAIRSSVSDMLKFLSVQMGITASPLSKAIELTHQPRHDKANGNSVGLGWHIAPGGEHEIIWHNGATGGYTTFIGFCNDTKTGVAVFTNSSENVDDIGFHLLNPERELKSVKPGIIKKLKEIIEKDGADKLTEKFMALKQKNADEYEISENDINTLGYYYLSLKKNEPALALFSINVMEYPNSANAYDSYAEALMKNGDNELAIKNYKKSLELNPGNSNAVEMLEKMGTHPELPEVKVDGTILETYVGTYELVPGFDIVVTKEEDHLFAQATGQDKFEIFPKSSTEFFYKVVDAQINFNKNDDGKIITLTLHQGGRDITGKKKE
ncbi:MAG: serine hydrolase [Saprospiraceae bacterium]|uniref:Beta-lactamase n=1 Tax=Candidatus Opimibacter skivensis TaxID=2982028 RepID=A0A9D7SSQ6_9BACT|nr:serine hydrolase [Candidatus Opimibacter skivensis]